MTTKQFNWLHLSDIHIGQKHQWLWPNFKAKFLDDLRRLSIDAGPIDLVLFSGDLTQNGGGDQYELLTKELLEIWEMWDKLGQNPFLFTVPGNHDLVRPPSNDARLKMLIQWDNDPDVVKEFWEEDDNQYIQLVRSAFANYSKWQNEVSSQGINLAPINTGRLPGDASSSLNLNGISVGLAGLNSSFLQLNGDDFNGKLALDLRQLNAITNDDAPKWLEKHEINFLITHHPSSWLSPKALREFNAEIYSSGRFAAHVCGHMHTPEIVSIKRGGDSGRRSLQGASIFGLEFLADGSTERAHGYSVGKISFHENEVTWKLWPRLGKVNRIGDRRLIPDHDNFELESGHEFLSEILYNNSSPSQSSTTVSSRNLDLASAVDESAPLWNNALQGTLFSLREQEHHLVIRPLQQQVCIESIRQNNMVWVCADWGLGRDGFLWSVIKRLGRDSQPVYRISLSNYHTRDEFLTNFSTMFGCSFPEFCKALAAGGAAILLLDETPVSSGDSEGPFIERDAENLASMVRDFCTDIILFLLARTFPRSHIINGVSLEPLDEADTKTYILAHPDIRPELKSKHAVNEIYRRTDGLPGNIDSTLKALRVVSLSELGSAISIGSTNYVLAKETIPKSLVMTVNELAESKDSASKRTYLLLKILAVLPNGESLQRLKYVDHQNPLFLKNAEDLLDLDLIQVRSSPALININCMDEDHIRILVAPRAVRDYVRTLMTKEEVASLVNKATALYFGRDWQSGKVSMQRLGDELTLDDGSILQNPHTLVLSLLEQEVESSGNTQPILNLCQIYCAALLKSKHYRNCVTVCKDVLSVIPEIGYDSNRKTIEFLLAKALRMTDGNEETRHLFERLLGLNWSEDDRCDLLLGYALCLQYLEDTHAIEIAKQLIKLKPKSGMALQAKSLILEMEADADNTEKLLIIENAARKRGFNTVANNLALKRISISDSALCNFTPLRQVYLTAIKDGDSYNAARAAVKIGNLSIRETNTITEGDLKNLINAYQYFYGERFSSLFSSSHKALWEFFERQGDVRNLLILFRHSSFIWRLHGNEENENTYVQRIIDNSRQILSTNVLTADKNTAYFLVRARDSTTISLLMQGKESVTPSD
jgi:Calcineurin-like phosphoesterase